MRLGGTSVSLFLSSQLRLDFSLREALGLVPASAESYGFGLPNKPRLVWAALRERSPVTQQKRGSQMEVGSMLEDLGGGPSSVSTPDQHLNNHTLATQGHTTRRTFKFPIFKQGGLAQS